MVLPHTHLVILRYLLGRYFTVKLHSEKVCLEIVQLLTIIHEIGIGVLPTTGYRLVIHVTFSFDYFVRMTRRIREIFCLLY